MPGVLQNRVGDDRDCCVEIDVIEDDVRRLSAELQDHGQVVVRRATSCPTAFDPVKKRCVIPGFGMWPVTRRGSRSVQVKKSLEVVIVSPWRASTALA